MASDTLLNGEFMVNHDLVIFDHGGFGHPTGSFASKARKAFWVEVQVLFICFLKCAEDTVTWLPHYEAESLPHRRRLLPQKAGAVIIHTNQFPFTTLLPDSGKPFGPGSWEP